MSTETSSTFVANLPTDNDFNQASRNIVMKADIYLGGATAAPLEVTSDNYLIDYDLLEEATSGDTPFDNISSNELSLTLYSPNGIFNPLNSSSPYYGQMRRGVRITLSTRTSAEQLWAPLGEFFVTDWVSPITMSTATITATDRMYDIFGRNPVELRIQRNISATTFLQAYFNAFDIVPVVDTISGPNLVMAYVDGENKEFLTEMAVAYKLLCNVNHAGSVYIRQISAAQPLRAILTDDDQIMDIDMKMSINNDYDAPYLTYYVPAESDEDTILSISPLTVPSGITSQTYGLSKTPLVRLTQLSLISEDGLCENQSASCDNTSITCVHKNLSDAAIQASFQVRGTYVNKIGHSMGTEGQNTLKVENQYIQHATQATEYFQFMQQFITNNVPILNARIRGNPLLEIGDKIRLVSTRYGVDFTGILLRQHYQYNGGLTSDITVLNAALVEVSP